jgi:hypothetical protein
MNVMMTMAMIVACAVPRLFAISVATQAEVWAYLVGRDSALHSDVNERNHRSFRTHAVAGGHPFDCCHNKNPDAAPINAAATTGHQVNPV